MPFPVYKYFTILLSIRYLSIDLSSQINVFPQIFFSTTAKMSQNISALHLPGIAPNISFIETQCTPALCNVTMYGTVTYIPSLYGNLIYGALFALFLVVQLIFVCIYRTWSYSFAMSAGLFLEIIGYYGRIAMHDNVFNVNYFLM